MLWRCRLLVRGGEYENLTNRLSLAGAVSLLCCQRAGAVAVNAAAFQASITPQLQQARYHYGRYIVKCYRELVFGPYRCHRFYRW